MLSIGGPAVAIFDFFRKRDDPTKRSTPPRRIKDDGKRLSDFPVLRDAWLKFQTDYLDEAREIAERHVHAPDTKMAMEARKIVALVAFRQGQHQAALPMFEQVAAHTGKAADLFNVMTCAGTAGNVGRAQEAFDGVIHQYEGGDTEGVPPLPYIWYYHGCALRDGGHPDAALPMVQKLRPVYEQLKITDDTFLHIRGVPFLSHTMSLAVDIFRSTGEAADACAWIRDFARSLDEDGQSYLAELLKQLKCPEA